MYRIELSPGEETVFRTLEELAVGVHNGVVTSRARIYHGATQKWLPIEFHPHYKQALEHPAARVQARPGHAPERTDLPSFAVARPATPAPAEPLDEVRPVIAPPPVSAPTLATPEVRAAVAQASLAAVPVAKASRASGVTPREAHETAKVRGGHDAVAHFEPAGREVPVAIAVADEPMPPEPRRQGLPPVMASPVLHLPTISYPQITPLEEPVHPHVPVSRVETAGVSAPSHRTLRLAGVFLALGLGTYALLSLTPFRSGAAPVAAEIPRALPPAPDSGSATPPATAGAPLPASVVMTQPASSGFAPALEPRAIVTASSAASVPATQPRAPAPPVKDSSIAPAPAQLDLAIPKLPGLEAPSTSGRQQSDSAAMQRILRAVNGGKDVPQSP